MIMALGSYLILDSPPFENPPGVVRGELFEGSCSRVVNQRGTDAYVPPEIDNLDSRFSRRYDIWSLGCIMLEVVAFVPLGHEGLHGERGLDHVRFTRSSWGSQKDHRFFCQESPKVNVLS